MKYLLFTAFSISLMACTKTKCIKYYTSNIPMTLSPTKDTFHIGDTIWIDSHFSHTIIDDSTQESVIVPNFDFQLGGTISKIDTNPYLAFQEYKFEFIQDIGTLHYANGIIPKYVYSNGEYHLKYAIIPNYEGVYLISFSCPGLYLNPFQSPDCKYYILYNVTMNNMNLSTNNYSLIRAAPDTLIGNTSEYAFNYAGAYCFVVVP